MYIGAVTLTARPGMNHQLSEEVKKMRDLVHQVTGVELTAWAGLQGVPVGSFAFTQRYESTAEWVQMWSTLVADSGYQQASATIGALAVGPAETANSQVVMSTMTGAPKPFLVVTTATMSGSVSKAMTWASEMHSMVTDVTGSGGLLLTPTTGSIFDVTWSFGYDSPDAVDAARDKINADPAYMEKLDANAGLFIDGSAQRFLLVQLS